MCKLIAWLRKCIEQVSREPNDKDVLFTDDTCCTWPPFTFPSLYSPTHPGFHSVANYVVLDDDFEPGPCGKLGLPYAISAVYGASSPTWWCHKFWNFGTRRYISQRWFGKGVVIIVLLFTWTNDSFLQSKYAGGFACIAMHLSPVCVVLGNITSTTENTYPTNGQSVEVELSALCRSFVCGNIFFPHDELYMVWRRRPGSKL